MFEVEQKQFLLKRKNLKKGLLKMGLNSEITDNPSFNYFMEKILPMGTSIDSSSRKKDASSISFSYCNLCDAKVNLVIDFDVTVPNEFKVYKDTYWKNAENMIQHDEYVVKKTLDGVSLETANVKKVLQTSVSGFSRQNFDNDGIEFHREEMSVLREDRYDGDKYNTWEIALMRNGDYNALQNNGGKFQYSTEERVAQDLQRVSVWAYGETQVGVTRVDKKLQYLAPALENTGRLSNIYNDVLYQQALGIPFNRMSLEEATFQIENNCPNDLKSQRGLLKYYKDREDLVSQINEQHNNNLETTKHMKVYCI
jgi:hypothetical protein